MDEFNWPSFFIFLLSCVATHMWFVLNKVQNNLSDEKKKVKVIKRDQLTLDESVGDFKLDTEKKFILVKDRLLELDQEISGKMIGDGGSYTLGVVARLDKLEGVKAPVKKTKKTKRKKS